MDVERRRPKVGDDLPGPIALDERVRRVLDRLMLGTRDIPHARDHVVVEEELPPVLDALVLPLA
jgi:hypothetical protein